LRSPAPPVTRPRTRVRIRSRPDPASSPPLVCVVLAGIGVALAPRAPRPAAERLVSWSRSSRNGDGRAA
jgi:hypothetical protein